jgi:predicted nucleotidyltransferase
MTGEEAQEEYRNRLNLFSKVNKTAVTFYNSNPKSTKMAAIDLNNEEVARFLKSLEQYQVKYLLVGGFAVAFHGYIRATEDLDLWIKDDVENIGKFKDVLKSQGVKGLDDIRSFDLIPGFTQFNLGTAGFTIDPMKSLKAFSAYDFDKCFDRAQEGEYNAIKFKVISAPDLLQEKLATNRPKDQGDIERLKNIVQDRKSESPKDRK